MPNETFKLVIREKYYRLGIYRVEYFASLEEAAKVRSELENPGMSYIVKI